MRYYTKTDEWILVEGDRAKIGISKNAAEQLGDVVFLDLPSIGEVFAKNDAFGAIESVKAASDLNMPIGGTISNINELLVDNPELINEDSYEAFIIEIKDFNLSELETLLSKEEYGEI